MISQEYSHQVSLARMPNWVAMYAMPPHSTQVVRRSAFLLNSSLTYTEVKKKADRPPVKTEEKKRICIENLVRKKGDHIIDFQPKKSIQAGSSSSKFFRPLSPD